MLNLADETGYPGRTMRSVYGHLQSLYGPYYDRISATEIRPYHNEITAVYCENAASYTVPYYCAQDYEEIRSVYSAYEANSRWKYG
jgi:hypothetical protein